jgi:hypothetical protein
MTEDKDPNPDNNLTCPVCHRLATEGDVDVFLLHSECVEKIKVITE